MQGLNLGDDTDFSLSEFPPKDGFNHLQWSSSFQASIIQVCVLIPRKNFLSKINKFCYETANIARSSRVSIFCSTQLQSAWWACLVATKNSFLMFQLYTRTHSCLSHTGRPNPANGNFYRFNQVFSVSGQLHLSSFCKYRQNFKKFKYKFCTSV